MFVELLKIQMTFPMSFLGRENVMDHIDRNHKEGLKSEQKRCTLLQGN